MSPVMSMGSEIRLRLSLPRIQANLGISCVGHGERRLSEGVPIAKLKAVGHMRHWAREENSASGPGYQPMEWSCVYLVLCMESDIRLGASLS